MGFKLQQVSTTCACLHYLCLCNVIRWITNHTANRHIDSFGVQLKNDQLIFFFRKLNILNSDIWCMTLYFILWALDILLLIFYCVAFSCLFHFSVPSLFLFFSLPSVSLLFYEHHLSNSLKTKHIPFITFVGNVVQLKITQ